MRHDPCGRQRDAAGAEAPSKRDVLPACCPQRVAWCISHGACSPPQGVPVVIGADFNCDLLRDLRRAALPRLLCTPRCAAASIRRRRHRTGETTHTGTYTRTHAQHARTHTHKHIHTHTHTQAHSHSVHAAAGPRGPPSPARASAKVPPVAPACITRHDRLAVLLAGGRRRRRRRRAMREPCGVA
jgi:hypothetical protein